MTDTYELPEPAAWLVASCLQWLTDPARTASAYTYPEMTRRNHDDGLERAPIFTADQMRAYGQEYARLAVKAERERCAKLAEDMPITYERDGHYYNTVPEDYAAAIRKG